MTRPDSPRPALTPAQRRDAARVSSALSFRVLLRDRGAWGLALICLFAFFWRLGSITLFDLDEALYVTCARQMVLTGDVITPRLNSRPQARPTETAVPFYEKPILVYWLSAASLRLLGISAGAARLPVACAALLTTGIIVLAGWRWFGRRAGLLAGLVYATVPMTLADARQMTTDGPLVLWITVALLAFWFQQEGVPEAPDPGRQIPPAEPPNTRIPEHLFPLLFWTMGALAVLTKGIVGLLLPFLVIGIYLSLDKLALRFHRRRGRRPVPLFRLRLRRPGEWWPRLRRLGMPLGLLFFLALSVPWHLLIWQAGGRDAQGRTFVQEYIVRQHVGRFRGIDKVHNAPLPTYAAYFLLGFFPWACFAPAAFRYGKRRLITGDMGEAEAARVQREASEADTGGSSPRDRRVRPGSGEEWEAYRFLLAWFWTIVLFFSAGAAKLPTYIVPAYPAAALLMGRWLDRVLEAGGQEKIARSLRRGATVMIVTAALLVVAACLLPRFARPGVPIPRTLAQLALHLTLLLLVGCAAAWYCFWHGWRKAGIGALAGMMLAVVGVGVTEGYTVAERYVLWPYQSLAAHANESAAAGRLIVYYGIVPRRPSMLYYARYAPLERKEKPLLPFLRPFLTPARPEAEIITSQRALKEPGRSPSGEREESLLSELKAAPEISAQIVETAGDAQAGWVRIRITRHFP